MSRIYNRFVNYVFEYAFLDAFMYDLFGPVILKPRNKE